MKLGIHTGPQGRSQGDLRRAWRTANEAGFERVSIRDHPRPAPTDPNEACFVATAE